MRSKNFLLYVLLICVLYLGFLTFNTGDVQYKQFFGSLVFNWGSNFPKYPPRELTAEALIVDDSSQIVILWKAPSSTSGIVGYRVYRCDGSSSCGPSTLIGSTTLLSYTDKSVLSSTRYNYAVEAYSSNGLSSPASEIVSVVAKNMWGTKTATPVETQLEEQLEDPALIENLSQNLTTTQPVSVIFIKSLYFGVKNEEVTKLQQFLATDKQVYPEGLITGYYGGLTVTAVGRFQVKYGILAGPGSLGYGMVGPKTRAKLNELVK
jgi:hypothetical protein